MLKSNNVTGKRRYVTYLSGMEAMTTKPLTKSRETRLDLTPVWTTMVYKFKNQKLTRIVYFCCILCPCFLSILGRWPHGDRLPNNPLIHANNRNARHGTLILLTVQYQGIQKITILGILRSTARLHDYVVRVYLHQTAKYF